MARNMEERRNMEQFTENEDQLRDQSTRLTSYDDYIAWEERCCDLIESLKENNRIKQPRLSIGIRTSIVARIARLEGLKYSVRRRFVHEGAGQSTTGFFWQDIETAFDSRIFTGAVINVMYIEPRNFLEDAKDVVLQHIQTALERHRAVKVNAVFNGRFVANEKRANKCINTKNVELFQTSNLQEWYDQSVVDTILSKLEEFQERDSGWALQQILDLTINVNKYNPLHAGCYFKLPLNIRYKGAIITVESGDNACFAWAVVAALYPVTRHTERSSSYPHYNTVVNFHGMEFPVSLNQIGLFERLNGISINVYGIEDHKIVPLRLSSEKMNRHVNLLYMENQHDITVPGHFACIKNLSRLVSSQLSKNKKRKYICDRCLHYFSSNEKLEIHSRDCRQMNDCAVVLPTEEDKWLTFQNYSRKERLPFVVYADLECILEKMTEQENQSSYPYQHHKVFSIAYYIQCSYDTSLSKYKCRRGIDCVSWFVKELQNLAHSVKNILSTKKPMDSLTPQQLDTFINATQCHVCKKPFAPSDARVRDHCHLTGRFRGPAHSNCNLQYQNSFFIPVVFHNLSGYDSHFIINELADAFEGIIDVLPITKEKYISFSKTVAGTANSQDTRNCIKLRFIDSYKFLSTSLEKLASYLTRDKFQILHSGFQNFSEEDLQLLTRKGVFPYEYIDCADKLYDTHLPQRESFYSSLTGETVSESDYAHAENVWQRFNIRTLGEYSDLYLKTDVLLLADIFENFRQTCIESYGLDPIYYFTLPGFAWDAMLKHTKVSFELLTDIDMVLFIERGIRGGLSQCSNRYAKANNKYMQSFDSSATSSYLMYFDVNNLYGWAMCQSLPYAEFRWVDDIANFDLYSITADSPIGYILEVDLEYPQHLHDLHTDLPFCPTRAKPPGKKEDKLLATLYDKQRYVIHYRNLQLCTRHGLRITKIYRILQFAQSPWLRDYIDLNTQFRTRASNDFEKNMYKLMNNAVFGKTMENVRNHVDVKLITKWDGRYGAEAMIAKPNFHSRSIFSENLVAIELRKLSVKFNKPIYVGMCILDISKICVYEFHHDYMVPQYGGNCCLMYTDTDSLIYNILTNDPYELMKRDIHRFDTSDYPHNNAYDIPLANKKVPGLMKDENNGFVMTEFVGLRAKMYALRVDGKKETKKAKGVKSNVIARTIMFDDYVQCLQNEIEMTCEQSRIISKLHNVYTVTEKKLALSPYDDKRYVVPDSIRTLPWGHYRIPL